METSEHSGAEDCSSRLCKGFICYIITISVLQAHKITQLRELINTKYGEQLENYQQLHRWSVQHYDKFWQEVQSRAWRIVTLI